MEYLHNALSQRGPEATPYEEAAKGKIREDVFELQKVYPTLAVKLADFHHNDGRTLNVLKAQGTVPINYQGGRYNIPVTIWLTERYPYTPPTIYVEPTPNMMIKAGHPNVDRSGTVTMPSTRQWISPSSNLVETVFEMSQLFSREPPLFARPTQPSPSSSSSSPSNPQSQPRTNPLSNVERAQAHPTPPHYPPTALGSNSYSQAGSAQQQQQQQQQQQFLGTGDWTNSSPSQHPRGSSARDPNPHQPPPPPPHPPSASRSSAYNGNIDPGSNLILGGAYTGSSASSDLLLPAIGNLNLSGQSPRPPPPPPPPPVSLPRIVTPPPPPQQQQQQSQQQQQQQAAQMSGEAGEMFKRVAVEGLALQVMAAHRKFAELCAAQRSQLTELQQTLLQRRGQLEQKVCGGAQRKNVGAGAGPGRHSPRMCGLSSTTGLWQVKASATCVRSPPPPHSTLPLPLPLPLSLPPHHTTQHGSLTRERNSTEVLVAELTAKAAALQSWLDANEPRAAAAESGTLPPDELFVSNDDLGRQALNTQAEDLALEDTTIALDRALQAGVIPLDMYLKQIRSLCRKQFFARALGMRITELQCRPPAPPTQPHGETSNLRHASSSNLHSYPVALASSDSLHRDSSWTVLHNTGPSELLTNPLAANR
ncbi:MAG: hypothetical protein WDW36_009337 [Sanguina aurantia]